MRSHNTSLYATWLIELVAKRDRNAFRCRRCDRTDAWVLVDHMHRWMEVKRFEEVLVWAGAKVQWPNLDEIFKSLHPKNAILQTSSPHVSGKPVPLSSGVFLFIKIKLAPPNLFILSMSIQCRSILYIAIRGRIAPFRRRIGKMRLGNTPHGRHQYIEMDTYLPLIRSAPSNMSQYPLFSILIA